MFFDVFCSRGTQNREVILMIIDKGSDGMVIGKRYTNVVLATILPITITSTFTPV